MAFEERNVGTHFVQPESIYTRLSRRRCGSMKWQFKFWGLWTLTALSSPLLLTWTFFGWILTSSPRICAVVSFILSSYLIGIASLYDTYLSLISQYLSFLLLFLYCFIYRSTTRLFRFAFLSLILLFQTSQLLSLHFVQYAPSRITLASDLTLFASLNIVVVLLNLWLPASEMKFLQVEEQFLQSRCDRKLIRILVASLGTIQVTDEVIDDTNREEDLVLIDNISKPILVLLHGYGGYNAQWADCLSKLQTRFQVYCVELYGFGRSSRVPWGQRWEAATLENSLDAMTSALEKWRETLQISRFILVTHSLSCYVGITYLLKYPGFVSHLYLTSPIGLNSTFSSYSPLNYRCQRTNSIYSPLHEVDQEVSKQELCGGTSCWSSRSISQILWANNFTPMDFLRWLGPLGPFCFSKFLSWYRSHLPESSVIHQYTPEQFHLFSQCYYQALASPAFGERCLSRFMSLSGQMHLSLVSLIEKYTRLTSPSSASIPLRSSFSYGTFQKNFAEKVKSLEMVTLVWGELDNLRSAEQNTRPDGNQTTTTPSAQRREKRIKPTMGRDWSGHLQESEFMTYLQVNGIHCEGYEVQMAGHLLYLDNPEEFCDVIIQSYEEN